MQLFDQFKKAIDQTNEKGKNERISDREQDNPHHSITEETYLLREFKDIRDELNIIRSVLADQKDTLGELFEKTPENGRLTEDFIKYCQALSGLEPRIKEIEKLDTDAIRTYEAVSLIEDFSCDCPC